MSQKFKILLPLVMSLILSLSLWGCGKAETDGRIKVMTSTSLMTYIVEQIGGTLVEVINLVPPNQHPGNFDAKPSDIEKLSTARLFLLHGWPGETYVDNLVNAANNPALRVERTPVNGNWMIPEFQAQAVDKVLAVLIDIDPGNRSIYEANAANYKTRILAKEAEIREQLAAVDVGAVNALVSHRQADFLTWAGFNVVATFTSPSAMTPQVVANLVDQGREHNVSIVVNNIQDGLDAGKGVAEELQAKNINLSNFPGGYIYTDSWENAITKNIDLLLEAIR